MFHFMYAVFMVLQSLFLSWSPGRTRDKSEGLWAAVDAGVGVCWTKCTGLNYNYNSTTLHFTTLHYHYTTLQLQP
jgi:hypothetical protein